MIRWSQRTFSPRSSAGRTTLATFSARGFHHGLVQPPGSEEAREQLLVPYYRTGVPRSVTEPLGTLTTRDRHGLLGVDPDRLIDECTFRMLEPSEIRRGMAFPDTFQPIGNPPPANR